MPPPGPGMPPFAHFAAVQPVPSMHLWVQQGLGHLAGVPGFMGSPDGFDADGPGIMEGPPPPDGPPDDDDERDPPGSLPWRDLRRFHSHLCRALGRTSSFQPALPPPSTPQGELIAYLSVLHAGTTQLGVAISDISRAMSEHQRTTERQRQAFTNVLGSAGRVLRSLHHTLRSTPGPEYTDSQPESTTIPDEEGEEEEGPLAHDEELGAGELRGFESYEMDAETDATSPEGRQQAPNRPARGSLIREPWDLDDLEHDDEEAAGFANIFEQDFRSIADVPAPNLLCFVFHRAASQELNPHNPSNYPAAGFRSYLGGLLHDMGQFLESNNAFRSTPDAANRYPHLQHLHMLMTLTGSSAQRGQSS